MKGGGDWNWNVFSRSCIRRRSLRAFAVGGAATFGFDNLFLPPPLPLFSFLGRPRVFVVTVGVGVADVTGDVAEDCDATEDCDLLLWDLFHACVHLPLRQHW